MATRSTIALEFADGTVGQVYCHWDGYLEHNGKLLAQYYTDPYKLRELIDLGDLSSLAPEIGVKHEFGNPNTYKTKQWDIWNEQFGKMCTFYNRDRGETGVMARYFKDFADYVANHQEEEYEYILRTDGKWYVKSFDTEGYIELSLALATQDALV